MKELSIASSEFHTVEELQEYIKIGLDFSDYYGENLAALYDCLTEIAEPTELVVPKKVADEAYLGWYGQQFLQLLEDAGAANEALKITLR